MLVTVCAVWRDNKNISEESVMLKILQEIGLDGEGLIQTAKHNTEVKEVLRSNTERYWWHEPDPMRTTHSTVTVRMFASIL